MNTLEFVFSLLHLLLAFFLVFPLLTVILAHLRREEQPPMPEEEADIACIITAYRNLGIAFPLVESLLAQQYQGFHVYLVADDCPEKQIRAAQFPREQVSVLAPPRRLGSKVRSINFALANLSRNHSHILILDPDNLAPASFLAELNVFLQAGYAAVQGVRTAKNLDTLYACLDATGELYYNYTVRYIPWRMGASSTISGSGMVIETSLYRAYLATEEMDAEAHEVIVAEDKLLQIDLIRRGTRIAYARKALLYDEKVTSGYQIERQRTRWLNSYFQHLPTALGLTAKGLLRLDYNAFLFGLFIAFPPMFLLVSGSMLLAGIDLLGWLIGGWTTGGWLAAGMVAAMALFVLNFLLVLYLGRAPREIWRSLWGIPVFIFKQFKALLRIRQANRDFLVTTHSKAIKIEELEKEK